MRQLPNGYLYAVVFDNGSARIGKSETSTTRDLRIAQHKLAARGLGHEPVFDDWVEVLTDDLTFREIALMAICEQHAGRRPGLEKTEWFIFENVSRAIACLKKSLSLACTEEGKMIGLVWSRSPKLSQALEIILRTGRTAAAVAREVQIAQDIIYKCPNYREILRLRASKLKGANEVQP